MSEFSCKFLMNFQTSITFYLHHTFCSGSLIRIYEQLKVIKSSEKKIPQRKLLLYIFINAVKKRILIGQHSQEKLQLIRIFDLTNKIIVDSLLLHNFISFKIINCRIYCYLLSFNDFLMKIDRKENIQNYIKLKNVKLKYLKKQYFEKIYAYFNVKNNKNSAKLK